MRLPCCRARSIPATNRSRWTCFLAASSYQMVSPARGPGGTGALTRCEGLQSVGSGSGRTDITERRLFHGRAIPDVHLLPVLPKYADWTQHIDGLVDTMLAVRPGEIGSSELNGDYHSPGSHGSTKIRRVVVCMCTQGLPASREYSTTSPVPPTPAASSPSQIATRRSQWSTTHAPPAR